MTLKVSTETETV